MNNKKRKIIILIDKLIGIVLFPFFILFSFLLKKPTIGEYLNNKKEVKNILLIRPGGIGDFLLAIPFFKKVRRIFPNAKITLFCFKRNMSSLEIYNNFDEIKVIDKLSVFLKFISKDVFLKKYDIVFDLEQCRKISTLISFLSRAPVKVGFGTNSRCSLYTHIVRYSHEDYEAVNFLRQLEYFSKDTEFKNEELSVPVFSNFCENVNVLVENYQGKKIAIYASAMKPENRLSIIRWKKILEEKGKNSTYFFVGSKADTKRHDELISELDTANFRIVRTEGKLSLLESLQLIGKMDLMITEDGGPLHLAVIADIPTISFWGPTVMSKWKPLSEKHKGIQSNIPCCPCTLGKFSEFRGCPYDFKCLK